MTYKEFNILAEVADNLDDVLEQIKALPAPKYVCGKRVPDNLNTLSYGEYLQLLDAKGNIFSLAPLLVLGIEDATNEDADTLLGFIGWVGKQLQEITNLFASTSIPPTKEEKMAGIEKLNFGTFGILDWYALRMGITDHAEVERVPWLRIYKCLDMEKQRTLFQRRLRQIMEKGK